MCLRLEPLGVYVLAFGLSKVTTARVRLLENKWKTLEQPRISHEWCLWVGDMHLAIAPCSEWFNLAQSAARLEQNMTSRGCPFLRHVPKSAVAAVVLASLGGGAMAEAHLSDTDPFQSAVQAVQAKDFASATSLFEILAEADDYDAQFNLAILLRAGQGRPQNFVQALEWSLLAQLGGVERAIKLSADLSELVTPDAQTAIFQRIDLRLRERLAQGDHSAIMQYIDFNSTTLPEPDMQKAYVWSLIAAALGLDDAAAKRDALMAELESDIILKLQDEARALFDEQEMVTLFAAQASGGL